MWKDSTSRSWQRKLQLHLQVRWRMDYLEYGPPRGFVLKIIIRNINHYVSSIRVSRYKTDTCPLSYNLGDKPAYRLS